MIIVIMRLNPLDHQINTHSLTHTLHGNKYGGHVPNKGHILQDNKGRFGTEIEDHDN